MKPHALVHTPSTREREHDHGLGDRVVTLIMQRYLLLPLGALIALIWANTRPESYFPFAQGASFAVNEIAMVLFFGLIAHEIHEDLMPGGALHTWRRWTLPLVAAVGGLAGSLLVYVGYLYWQGAATLASAWPVAAAIDLAFAYFVVKHIFHRRGAVGFLLVAAAATNVVAMLFVVLRHP